MFRPWGHLDWALNMSGPRKWDFIGCLGPEERSISALIALENRSILANRRIYRIEETDSPYAKEAEKCIAMRESECNRFKLRAEEVNQIDLLAPIDEIATICEKSVNSSIILDITSLPKRFFFYLLKYYYKSEDVRDLVVSYTVPAKYPNAPLSQDHDPWNALPTFRQPDPKLEESAHKRLLVSIGFIPDGLISHLEGHAEERQIELIVPFPSPVLSYQRSWQSVWALKSRPHKTRFREHLIPAHDLSEAFDMIISLLPVDSNLVSFAPFGPKPISAAMCIYSSITGSPVYYSQPKSYLPNYSLGIDNYQGKSKIFAYWIKHARKRLYDIPQSRK